MKLYIDYFHPLIFLGLMLLFAFIGSHEAILGLNLLIGLVIWFIISAWVFNSISKEGLSDSHPKTFFALMLTLTAVGAFTSSYMNVETFILLMLWAIIAEQTWRWLKRDERAERGIYQLLAGQFVALSLIVPALMNYTNVQLLADFKHQQAVAMPDVKHGDAHAVEGHAVHDAAAGTHDSQDHIAAHDMSEAKRGVAASHFVLGLLKNTVFIISLLLAWYAWRLSRNSTEPVAAKEPLITA